MTAPTPPRAPPTMRPPPKRPPDPYAKARWWLHAIAVAALFAPGTWLPLRASIAIIFACEATAFALHRRRPEDEPTDATDVGMRIGCGAIFGLIAVPIAAYWWDWIESDAGLVVFAVAGAVVCAGLALRYGDRFWDFVLRNPRSPI